MIIEEKKANKLRCCGPLAEMKCQGSQCMAWRWNTEKNPEYTPPHPMVGGVRNLATEPSPWRISTTHGFCGLAGRP